MLLSKPLVHNILNLDTVELDLIFSLTLFHVLVPTFQIISDAFPMHWLFELVYEIAVYVLYYMNVLMSY